MTETRVAVVIPAFNAESTIQRTLRAVLAQTHAMLDVIVVDDGSTDATPEIVRRLAASDSRLRVLTTPNRGPAAARNAGIEQSRAQYVAFVDADDLWHESKIARQLECLAADPAAGFVYSPFRVIDADDRVRLSPPCARCEGWVFLQHALTNFVGNGSAILVRRQCLDAVGGFDEDSAVIGCEDILLQLRLAARFPVRLVPEYLVGYRVGSGTLSSRYRRMYRTRLLVDRIVRAELPHMPWRLRRWVRASHALNYAQQTLRTGRWMTALRVLLLAGSIDPLATLDRAWALAVPVWRRYRPLHDHRDGSSCASETVAARLFRDWDPDEPGHSNVRGLLRRRLAALAKRDARRGSPLASGPPRD